MGPMSKEQRIQLVRSLRLDAGQAEVADPTMVGKAYYPVAEHLRALEPEVVLIVGDRGAGKSMLQRVASERALRQAILDHTPSLRSPTGITEWLDGYPLHARGPDSAGWEQFANRHRGQPTALQDLWFAYLARTLEPWLDDEAKKKLAPLLQSPGGDPDRCSTAFKDAGTEVLLAIDRLDSRLGDEDRWIVVAYDELDTILFSDWDAMGAIVRGLISFWARQARRWRRVRAKLFLRTDFYRHHSNVVGADIAKLAANRVELSWSDKNLYAALIKHIANRSEDLFEYCRRAVNFDDEDAVLGHIPKILRKEDAQPFVERLVGKYMGADKKKGRAFTWILDHVRDGNGKASPRSLVLLIEQSALLEGENPRAKGQHLLHPVSLGNALNKVSEQYVDQVRDVFPWLAGLKERLAEERKVPWQRKELETLLRARWNENWAESAKNMVRPPAETPRELVEYLVELGIMRDRGGDRFDVPDLFLTGLTLRRKGGVRRR